MRRRRRHGALDALIFYLDLDEDGFGDAEWYALECARPRYFATDATDCYDGNSDAYPGSTAQMSVDRGDGSYDYNCDGVETMLYPSNFSCVANTSYNFGWKDSPVPRCGDWGTLSAAIQPLDCGVTFASYPQSCY